MADDGYVVSKVRELKEETSKVEKQIEDMKEISRRLESQIRQFETRFKDIEKFDSIVAERMEDTYKKLKSVMETETDRSLNFAKTTNKRQLLIFKGEVESRLRCFIVYMAMERGLLDLKDWDDFYKANGQRMKEFCVKDHKAMGMEEFMEKNPELKDLEMSE